MNKEKKGSSFGVLIILIGIGILLYNLDILRFSMFWGIVKLWPLLLILAGLSIIFKRVRYMNIVLWLIFTGIVIGYSYLNQDEMSWSLGDTEPTIIQEVAADGVIRGELTYDLNTGSLTIDSHDKDTLIYEVPESGIIEAAFDLNTLTASHLKIQSDSNKFQEMFRSKKYSTTLPTSGIWTFDVNAGVMDITMNLEEVALENGRIDLGVGDIEIQFGEVVSGELYIDIGVGDVTLDIPESVGVKIISNGGLTTIDAPGLSESNDVYLSDNFESAGQQLTVYLDLGIGSFDLE